MSKKIFIAAGSLILALVGYLSTSAHRKLTATTAYWLKGSSYVTLFAGASATTLNLTTVKPSGGKTAFFGTTAGTTHTLFSNKSGSVLYFK